MRNTYSRAKSKIHPLPAIIDFKQGAGVWVSYGTAYHALYRWAEARASETALVHGASGGVGVAALQIARAMGLKVLGTAGTPKGLELAKQEGAHQVFDHRKAKRNSASDGQPRRRHHSRNARQCESLLRHETFGQ